MRFLVLVKGQRVEFANILAAVGKAAAAGFRDFIAADGTFIAGNFNNLNHVRIRAVAPDSCLDALRNYCAILVYAAARRRLVIGNDSFRNIVNILKQRSVPCFARNLAQNLIFCVLYLGIELSSGLHCFPSLYQF